MTSVSGASPPDPARVEALRHWRRALQVAATVEAGGPSGWLSSQSHAQLRLSVLPSLENAIADLTEGLPLEDLAWRAAMTDAIESLSGHEGLDPGLVAARDFFRRGLVSLGLPGELPRGT